MVQQVKLTHRVEKGIEENSSVQHGSWSQLSGEFIIILKAGRVRSGFQWREVGEFQIISGVTSQNCNPFMFFHACYELQEKKN